MQSHERNFEDDGQTDRKSLPASERRTLDAIFRHPLQHNLEWSHVLALIESLGGVEQKPNNTLRRVS